jgi:hypothetical protein
MPRQPPSDSRQFYGGGEGISQPSLSTDRRRSELDELLTMAEELQDAIERSTQQFLTTTMSALLVFVLGFITFGVVAFTVANTIYRLSLGLIIALSVLVGAFLVTRIQTRFKLQQQRDRRALQELLSIVHEVAPIFKTAADWSPLDEARLRIRLSRFGVGRSSASRIGIDKGLDRFTQTMRFLLDQANSQYRSFVERLFQNIDVAVKNVMDAADFEEVLARAHARVDIVPDDVDFQTLLRDAGITTVGSSRGSFKGRLIGGQWGALSSWAIFEDGHVVMSRGAKRDFDGRQYQLRIQLGEPA